MRRVVITGLGLVSPLASGVEETWKRLIAGESGARRITEFEVDDLACQIACRIPVGDGTNGTFNPDLHMEAKEQRKVDPFIVYAVGAADQALDDADWHPESDEDQVRTGVLIGSGIGGIEGIVEAGYTLRDKATPHFALLHSGPSDQSGFRPRFHQAQAARSKPFGRDRLRNRHARYR